MAEFVAVVPDMWADHHVLLVREALKGLPGIDRIEASARDLTVRVAYDSQQADPETIAAALTTAGYPPGEPAAGETRTDKPEWSAAPRVTRTDPSDLTMSGDYRQY